MAPKDKKTEKGNNDFNIDDIAPKMSQHDADIASLHKRTTDIEDKLNTDEGFAMFFKGILDRSKTMEDIVKGFIHKAVKDDDRSVVFKTLRRFATLAGWIASLIIAGFIGHFWK